MKGRQVRRPRPQPLCAGCGGAIGGTVASITLTALELPGRPRIAWHGGCAQGDGACDDYIHHRRAAAEVIREIEARGPYRAVRDVAASKKEVTQ